MREHDCDLDRGLTNGMISDTFWVSFTDRGSCFWVGG